MKMHGPGLRECPEAEGIVKLLDKSGIDRGPKRIDFGYIISNPSAVTSTLQVKCNLLVLTYIFCRRSYPSYVLYHVKYMGLQG
jgi:hypothetical protein